MEDSMKTPPSSKDNIPNVLSIEMTYQFYAARKEFELKKAPAIARQGINLYFEWLKNIKPTDVVDAIEQGKTVEQARKEASIAMRLGIASARGILKSSKDLQIKLKEIATIDLALMTLKYENPRTYQVIESYGEHGIIYLKTWIQDALKLLGVT
jgi:predicted RNase H-like HicB family nuclease